MNTAPSPAIDCDRLTVVFSRGPALEDITFRLEPGEFLGVVGPNGSGKTTLFKTILGLVKPAAGRITVLGTTPPRARSRIGYVPQRRAIDPDFPISVLEAVLMGTYPRLGIGRSPGRRERERALAALAAVGLADSAGHVAGHLSGGQQQRLFLARALVNEPAVLLLDEPTSAVDAATRQTMVELIRRLHTERSLTTLYVTHDINEVMLCVDKVMYLKRTVQAFGPCAEVLTQSMLERLYGAPVMISQEADRRYIYVGDSHA